MFALSTSALEKAVVDPAAGTARKWSLTCRQALTWVHVLQHMVSSEAGASANMEHSGTWPQHGHDRHALYPYSYSRRGYALSNAIRHSQHSMACWAPDRKLQTLFFCIQHMRCSSVLKLPAA